MCVSFSSRLCNENKFHRNNFLMFLDSSKDQKHILKFCFNSFKRIFIWICVLDFYKSSFSLLLSLWCPSVFLVWQCISSSILSAGHFCLLTSVCLAWSFLGQSLLTCLSAFPSGSTHLSDSLSTISSFSTPYFIKKIRSSAYSYQLIT